MSPLTRRHFLRLLAAGSSLAFLPACRQASNRVYRIPGEIVNPNPIAGHLLRAEQAQRNFVRENRGQYDVVVVGGGISGLSAAWKLKKAGVERVLLLELGPEVGGTAIAGSGPATPFPWGAHYINIPPQEADCIHEVLGDIGVIEGYDSRGWPRVKAEYVLRWPKERLYRGDAWVENLDPFLRDRDSEEYRQFEDDMLAWTLERGRDGHRSFAMPLQYSSRDAEARQLDEISFRDYLYAKGWKSDALHWLADYACRDDYGSLSSQVSAWAGIHYFACRNYDYRLGEEYPADTLTWPEGNAFLANKLGEEIDGVECRKQSLVLRLEIERNAVRIGYVDLQDGVHWEIEARTAIYAAKLYTAPYIISGLPARQRETMGGMEYSPWLIAALHLNALPKGGQVNLAWDNVLLESPSLGYVVADHQSPSPGGRSVWVYYLPFVEEVDKARQELLDRDHSFWVNFIMRDLESAHPDLEDVVDRIDIYRWGHAMVRPAPRQIWGEGSHWRQQPLSPIFFATCDATGLPLFEEACFTGIRAAQQAMDHLGLVYQNSLQGLSRDRG